MPILLCSGSKKVENAQNRLFVRRNNEESFYVHTEPSFKCDHWNLLQVATESIENILEVDWAEKVFPASILLKKHIWALYTDIIRNLLKVFMAQHIGVIEMNIRLIQYTLGFIVPFLSQWKMVWKVFLIHSFKDTFTIAYTNKMNRYTILRKNGVELSHQVYSLCLQVQLSPIPIHYVSIFHWPL